eukprot:112411_1
MVFKLAQLSIYALVPIKQLKTKTHHQMKTKHYQLHQLLESSNKCIIKSRIDVLNQYGCMSSCICKLLHILSPKEWDENETRQLQQILLKLKQRLLKLFLQLSPYISTTLELVRSRQLQQIFSSLISFETTKKKKNRNSVREGNSVYNRGGRKI